MDLLSGPVEQPAQFVQHIPSYYDLISNIVAHNINRRQQGIADADIHSKQEYPAPIAPVTANTRIIDDRCAYLVQQRLRNQRTVRTCVRNGHQGLHREFTTWIPNTDFQGRHRRVVIREIPVTHSLDSSKRGLRNTSSRSARGSTLRIKTACRP